MKLQQNSKEAKIRCSVDERSEKIGYKIRDARLNKIPYMLVVGAKEARRRSGICQKPFPWR